MLCYVFKVFQYQYDALCLKHVTEIQGVYKRMVLFQKFINLLAPEFGI
jgi:hypothetical protein